MGTFAVEPWSPAGKKKTLNPLHLEVQVLGHFGPSNVQRCVTCELWLHRKTSSKSSYFIYKSDLLESSISHSLWRSFVEDLLWAPSEAQLQKRVQIASPPPRSNTWTPTVRDPYAVCTCIFPSHLHHWKHDNGAVGQGSQSFKDKPSNLHQWSHAGGARAKIDVKIVPARGSARPMTFPWSPRTKKKTGPSALLESTTWGQQLTNTQMLSHHAAMHQIDSH
jgi:hypothetical protein